METTNTAPRPLDVTVTISVGEEKHSFCPYQVDEEELSVDVALTVLGRAILEVTDEVRNRVPDSDRESLEDHLGGFIDALSFAMDNPQFRNLTKEEVEQAMTGASDGD